ncbi:MAG: sensor histidine kinase N-terminal domain-containing protein, partial [Rhodoferax sp.]|nr:sensor histidine kinase N-terminal domain-containing protein [Rhodoferax sp.]
QGRLLALALGFACVVWLGAAVLTWRDAQHEIDELLDGHLAQAAALLLVHTAGDPDDVFDAPVTHPYSPQVVFQVFVHGQLITRSNNVGPEPMVVQADGFSTVRREDGELWRVVSTRDVPQDVTVLVAEKMESRQSILWAVMRSLLSPLVAALPLFGLALWWSVRQGLAPIRDLRERLDQRAPQAAEPVSLQGMPRELEPLVHTLNGLLERISRMVQTERRFTADAAHELRTPIAAIRMQAQVAQGAGDEAERSHALQTTLAGCDRASHLVDQLLTLARLENAPASPAMPVDLGAVVRRVAGELVPAALARQQDIAVQADAVCPVAANEVLLGVLVRNLLDNALRYSPPGARVEVAVGTNADGVHLQVQDSGPGMADEAIAHLGERFFRVLGHEQTGSGLGWSIVRRVLDVMGASVQIGRAQALGGLAVSVHWPVAAS